MTSPVAEIPVPERYRAVILSFGGVLAAALLQLSEVMVPGRPLGGVEAITVAVAAVTSLVVYFPASPWAKFAAAIAGTIGQTLISATTDGQFTAAELLTIAVMVLSAMGIGAFPNAPARETSAAAGPGGM